MVKFLTGVLGGLLFTVLLVAVYWSYISFFRVNVVFYGALFSVAISLAIYALLLFALPVFRVFDGFDRLNALVIAGLFGYALAISVPTVIDRSLSFYILEKIQQRGGGIRIEQFESLFVNEYMKEHRLVDIRLTEQLESGTIEITDTGCVRLTSKGDNFADFSLFFRRNLLPKSRLIRGEYTDDLVDPFRNGQEVTVDDYRC